jgi:RNA-splicing ligase RtcB
MMIELKGKYNKDCKIFIDDVEYSALSTIHRILDSPVSENLPIRIMPDVHEGVGIVIGFSMPLGRMLSPTFVGVDIGCSVTGGFFKYNKKKLNLNKIDEEIRNTIPMGFNHNKNTQIKLAEYPFGETQKMVNFFVEKYNKKFNTTYDIPEINDKWLIKFLKRIGMDSTKFWNSLSSLGGGNHYISLEVNKLDECLVSVHSGSRNLGQKVCFYHVNQAKLQTNFDQNEYAKRLDDIKLNTIDRKTISKKIQELRKEMNIGINKEYLQGEFLFNYLIDMIFTQKYASVNRELMINKIKDILNVEFDRTIETVHNYIDFSNDDFMIRKGAISAKKDEMCLVPISQKFGTFLVKAKGSKDWNETLCHGAGRVMSRSEAKSKISVSQVEKSMKGIVCRVNKNVVDESEFCYKKPEVIKEAIFGNGEVVSTYTPVLNIKDIGESISWKEKRLKEKKDKSEQNNRKTMRRMKGNF